jgi:hypothetical protein
MREFPMFDQLRHNLDYYVQSLATKNSHRVNKARYEGLVNMYLEAIQYLIMFRK